MSQGFRVVPAIEPWPCRVRVKRGRGHARKELQVPGEVLHEGSESCLVKLLSSEAADEDNPMWKAGAFHVVSRRDIVRVMDVPF